jgi:hypothetical protein
VRLGAVGGLAALVYVLWSSAFALHTSSETAGTIAGSKTGSVLYYWPHHIETLAPAILRDRQGY